MESTREDVLVVCICPYPAAVCHANAWNEEERKPSAAETFELNPPKSEVRSPIVVCGVCCEL